MSDFDYSKDKDNIVSIKWDVNGKSMNVLTLDGMASLKTCVNKALNDKTAKGIIISSSKKVMPFISFKTFPFSLVEFILA